MDSHPQPFGFDAGYDASVRELVKEVNDGMNEDCKAKTMGLRVKRVRVIRRYSTMLGHDVGTLPGGF